MPITLDLNVAVVWAMLLQAGGSIWWAATVNATLKKHDGQLKALTDALTARLNAETAEASRIGELTGSVKSMGESLGRLIGRVDQISGGSHK